MTNDVGRFKLWTSVRLWGSSAPEIAGVWTDDDDWLVSMSGWRIGTTDGVWCIKCEPKGTLGVSFATDEAASEFVYAQAAKGSDIHKRAVACVAARNMGITGEQGLGNETG